MSGHSKWATIKRAKGKTDAARGKVFTKIGREIAVAVKAGGADPSSNAKLRDIISKAKSANMPNDNIQRSIKKASGELGSINYETIVYEGYGIGGIAVIVETLTDNKNRTAGEVRHIFDKYGAGMGATGCVSYMFESKGVIIIDKVGKDEDTVMMDALESGAEDFASDDETFTVTTSVADYLKVRDALEGKGYEFLESGLEKIPANYVKVTDEAKFSKMLDMFDENDDVQKVSHNAEE